MILLEPNEFYKFDNLGDVEYHDNNNDSESQESGEDNSFYSCMPFFWSFRTSWTGYSKI